MNIMTNYYEKKADGTIGQYTNSFEVAQIRGFDFQTNEEIVGYEGKSYLKSELAVIQATEEYKTKELEKAKAIKLSEIDTKAYEYEDKGLIAYEGVTPEGVSKVVQIETTDKNIGKINGLINMFNANLITEYLWSTKDDTPIVLHPEDCYALTGLFAEFSADIWMVKQPGYKAAVEACGTVEEVEGVLVDYSQALAPNEERSSISTD